MWHLVKKDILLCRMGIVIILLINFLLGYLSLFIMVMLSSRETISTIMLGYFLFLGLSLTIVMVLEREQKVDGDMILHSIPLDKKLIITSRYISSLLFPTVHGLILFVYSYILKYIQRFKFSSFRLGGEVDGISIYSLLTVLTIIIIFLAIYLPIYYSKHGKNKYLSAIAYTILVILPALVVKFNDNIVNLDFIKYINLLDKRVFTLVAFIISLVLYAISMEVSKRLYS